MTDFLTDGDTDILDGRIFVWTVSKKVLKGFLTDCQKKFLTDCFRHFFGQFLAMFLQILAIFGQYLGKTELFPWRKIFLCRRLTLIA